MLLIIRDQNGCILSTLVLLLRLTGPLGLEPADTACDPLEHNDHLMVPSQAQCIRSVYHLNMMKP